MKNNPDRKAVADGNTVTFEDVRAPFTVQLEPGSATLTCKTRAHPDADLQAIDEDVADYTGDNVTIVGLGPAYQVVVEATGGDGFASVYAQP